MDLPDHLTQQLREESWKGLIAVEMSVSEHDLSSLEIPDPCYLLINRMAYLPVVCDDIVSHFRSYVVNIANEVWFEFKGRPLKW